MYFRESHPLVVPLYKKEGKKFERARACVHDRVEQLQRLVLLPRCWCLCPAGFKRLLSIVKLHFCLQMCRSKRALLMTMI